MLVGMTVFTGQYWADRPKLGKEQLAALIVNLAWHGLSRLEAKPELRYEGTKAKRAREAAEKAEQKAEQKAKRDRDDGEEQRNSSAAGADTDTNDTDANATAESTPADHTNHANPSNPKSPEDAA